VALAFLLLSIASQLAKLQHYTPDGQFVKPEYVRFDAHTIFASLLRDDGAQEVVAFHVSRKGTLQRVAAFEADIRAMELRDVTGDGVPELLVTGLPGNRSSGVDILKWTGKEFEEIGETSDHGRFIDIDGDGVPEIVEQGDDSINECDARTGPVFVMKLKNGTFEDDERPSLLAVDLVTKREIISWFLPDDVSTHCTIRMLSEGATSVRVTIGKRTLPLHEGAQPINLPSRCTEADVRVTGGSAVLLLESR
jgi:hypothetical protein